MNRMAEAIHGGFHHALAQRGVRVDGEPDGFEERVQLERERPFPDEGARLATGRSQQARENRLTSLSFQAFFDLSPWFDSYAPSPAPYAGASQANSA